MANGWLNKTVGREHVCLVKRILSSYSAGGIYRVAEGRWPKYVHAPFYLLHSLNMLYNGVII